MKNILLKLAKANKNLVVLSVNAARCGDFAKFFPDRFFAFGAAEANMISCAAGFALAGKLPVVVGDSEFLFSRSFDQIYNDICLPNLNVKIFAVGKGDENFESAISSLPNLKIYKEKDTEEIEKAVNEYGPVYVSLDEL